MNLVPIVLTGGTVGAGVALLVREVLMRPQPALAPALRRTAPSSLPAAAEEGLDRDEVWGRWLLARLERLYAPSSAKTGSDEDVQLQSIVIYTADVSGSLVGGTGEVIGFPRRPGGHELGLTILLLGLETASLAAFLFV
ncbi:hypothetical protein [Streptomyces rochei]|uniref:hypothetical protein n=1 Tax=Streptomyces rochei TaxID=1928 RepID=UPI003530B255